MHPILDPGPAIIEEAAEVIHYPSNRPLDQQSIREVLEASDLPRVRSTGYEFQIELTYRAWKRGFKVREVPIVFADRRVGKSKMSRRIVLEALWMVWKIRFDRDANSSRVR